MTSPTQQAAFDRPALPVTLTSVAQLSAQGGWRVALPHGREDHLLIWITRGQGRALIDGVRRGLGAGNALWLPAGTQFSLDLGPLVFGQALIIRDLPAEMLPDRAQHLRVRDVSYQGELAALLEMIQREARDLLPFVHEALTAKFDLVQVWLRRMMLEVGAPEDKVHLALPEPAPKAHSLATQFARDLERNYRHMRRAEDYATAMGITPTHLARVCTQVSGMSAADLIVARSLHEARRLLEDTNLSAQHIAAHLGFGSAAYFSRFIARHTGRQPSSMRPTGTGAKRA